MSERGTSQRLDLWREITILAVMVMEISWGVLSLQMFSPPLRSASSQLIFLLMLMTVFLAYVFTRLASGLNLKKGFYRGLLTVVIIFCSWVNLKVMLAGTGETTFTDFLTQPVEEVSQAGRLIPPELWILIVTLILAWRGLSLAQSWGGRFTVFRSMQWGIGLFALYGLVCAVTHQAAILWPLYTFIAADLLAMVTARVSTLVQMRGGTHSPFDVRWMSSILGASLLVTSMSGLISVLAARQVDRMNEVLRLAFYGLITVLILPFAYLLKLGEPAVEAVQKFIPTPTPVPQIPAYEQGLDEAPVMEFITEVEGTGGTLWSVIEPIVLVAIFLLLLILLLRAANAWKTESVGSLQDERQSLLEGTNLWRALIEALRNRLFRSAEDFAAAARLRRKDRVRAAARIRRIYAELMDLCNELGQPRPTASTPLEFLPAATHVFPEQEQDLVEITRGYLRVRYGELPETHGEVEAVEKAWQRVSDQGTLIKKQLKSNK